MRKIVVPKVKKKDWSYVELNSSHYDDLINEDCSVSDESGKIIAIFLKGALSRESVYNAWQALKDWHPKTPGRAKAKGVKQEYKYIKGKKTNLMKGRTYCCSGVIGYFERFPTIPCCRPCSFNSEKPESFELLRGITSEISEIHKFYDQKSWGVYEDFSQGVKDCWEIFNSPYNTITMNKNFRTFPHKDARNLNATCPMTVIRKGSYKGGHLVFPDYRLAFNIDTTDVILFMNSDEWHGNTRLVGEDENNVRTSLIWYCRKKMADCLDPTEELKRAQSINNGLKDR